MNCLSSLKITENDTVGAFVAQQPRGKSKFSRTTGAAALYMLAASDLDIVHFDREKEKLVDHCRCRVRYAVVRLLKS